jgi:hypothetical protein
MTKKYASFVVRCWSHEHGTIRIRVEHVQTKESYLTDSFSSAMVWIESISRASRISPFVPGINLTTEMS